jgi:lipid II:glycine glycyltransferase (peptidoglycan interpeptide bridge formation enzyme)
MRTFVVDLRRPLEEMMQKFPRTWRQSLRFAEKQGLRIWEASEPGHLERAAVINRQMKARKSYIGSDSGELLAINADLPKDLRLKVLLCDHDGETIAALGWSHIGKVSFPLVGGTGDKALKFRASYLLWWEMIKSCQADGFTACDTAGVHQERNPGGYLFKRGVAGRDAQETAYIGQFDAYSGYPAYLVFKTAMSLRESLRNGARRLKSRLRKKNRPAGKPEDTEA